MSLYRRTPLFVRILIGALLGVCCGWIFGDRASVLKPVSDMILQALRLTATPLVFLSIVHSIISARVESAKVGRLAWILLSNTLIAICLGLSIANLVRPGEHVHLPNAIAVSAKPFDPVATLLEKIPKNWVDPFGTNDLVGIIVLGVVLGLGLRRIRSPETEARIATLTSFVDLGLKVVFQLIHWLLELAPLAVFAVIARMVGTTGLASVLEMVWFVGSVLIGLILMFGVYLMRIQLSSRIPATRFLRGGFDAFALAFSTASSAATLPVTFECATEKLGVSEDSASLGILVGGTFNHDGTALYEAMAALFIGQAIGINLSLGQQFVVVLMAILASVGAAGIPEAGFVTMLAVFSAVHLPLEYVPLLLPLDWILDRFRTMINVTGDLAATCLIDR